MSYRESKMGLLVRLDPAAAALQITQKIKEGGSINRAAVLLGEQARSVRRWIAALRVSGHFPVKPAPKSQAVTPG